MATRAVYTFSGFPGLPECHYYLHHDGYPIGAALRFSAALRHSCEATSFLTSFLNTQHQAEPLASQEQAADAEYRYLVQLLPGSDPRLQVQCWRRLPEGSCWRCRCGPMALVAFIQRFLPCDQP